MPIFFMGIRSAMYGKREKKDIYFFIVNEVHFFFLLSHTCLID